MVQAAQARLRHDCTPIRGPNSARRRLLSEAQVRAAFMVIANIVRQQALEVAFIEGNNVI